MWHFNVRVRTHLSRDGKKTVKSTQSAEPIYQKTGGKGETVGWLNWPVE